MRHLSTRALAGAFAFAGLAGTPAVYAQTLTHLYTLDGVYTDLLGGPSLTGNGGTFGPNGLHFGANQGPSLSGGLADIGAYSIETYFNFGSVGGWAKILDFKDRSIDYGVYNHNGANRFYPIAGTEGEYSPGVMAHLVVTRGAGDMFTAYVDGELSFSFSDTPGHARFTGPSGIMHFFRDDLVGSSHEAQAGFVDYIRIYDGAISAEQVAGRYANRLNQLEGVPDNEIVTPEPLTMLLVGSGLAAVGAARRRRSRRES